MIQNSLSPVAKSRISSFWGKTIRVEKRSFARTGMMSCWEYFIVLAPPGSARTGDTSIEMKERAARTRVNAKLAFERVFILYLLVLNSDLAELLETTGRR